MAEGSSLSTHSSANDIRGDERQPATSPLSHHTEAVGELKNKIFKLMKKHINKKEYHYTPSQTIKMFLLS